MAIMKENKRIDLEKETHLEYMARHAIPAEELPAGISNGWRFAGEPSTSKPMEITETIQVEEPFAVDMLPQDYLDPEEDFELQEFFDEEMANREENAYMANEATIDWLRAREAVNDLFTGTQKGRIRVKRKRQDFNEVEENHGWYGGKNANDRDDRRKSRIEDWDNLFSVDDLEPDSTVFSLDWEDYENDFDWDAFNAESDSGSTISARSQEPADERDTDEFQRVEQFMRHNAPRHTPGKRAIR